MIASIIVSLGSIVYRESLWLFFTSVSVRGKLGLKAWLRINEKVSYAHVQLKGFD